MPSCVPAISWRWSRAAIQAETEVGVAQRLLLQAQTALGSADPDWALRRVGRHSRTGCWSWPAARGGSDDQLAFVNALCTSVLSTRHVVVLADLLDHDPAEFGLPGLSIDTDLRWRIVTALAAAGDIDAEARKRPSSTPRSSATRPPRARARRTSLGRAAASAVKEQAWTQVTEEDTLPNIVGRSIITGFVQPGQAELLKPFGARYFAAIPGMWERRSARSPRRWWSPVPVVGYERRRDRCGRRIPRRSWAASGAAPTRARGPRGVERSLRARRFDGGGAA